MKIKLYTYNFIINIIMNKINKVVIIGSGPAGHTASIYSARFGLNPLMFEGFMVGGIAPGGQLTTTSLLENYPGFPEGIDGLQFCENLRNQSLKFGTIIETKTVIKIECPSKLSNYSNLYYPNETNNYFKIYCEGETEPILSYSVIIASGSAPKRLNVINEDKYWQKGISTCAVCDGPLYKNKKVAVVGGGDSACEEALHLSNYASEVHLIHRRDSFRASEIMKNKVLNNKKITIHYNSEVIECNGDKTLNTIKLKNVNDNSLIILNVNGLFYAIGHIPNTNFLKDTNLNLDSNGYIITEPGTSKTNIKGLFAAGDVQNNKYKQAITAASAGCIAAYDAYNYLSVNSLL